MREFRDFLLSTIDRLDRRYAGAPPEAVLETGREYAIAAERAGNLAAKLGLADLYRRSLDFGEFAEWPHVKAYLAECLAAVPTPPEPVPIGETIGVEELAMMLGVNVRTIYRRRNDGTLPAPIQIGRLVRWRRADVEAFMGSK
jgi:excisionase family DNA binding protein